MKIYISTDFEGVAGIVHWDQIITTGNDYAIGRALLVGELDAAIRGAAQAGATDFTVNDSHAHMRNIPPEDVDPRARLILGHFKPMYMMQGLDATYDAVFFLGYHAAIGSPSAVLTHTYNPRAIWEARIDGRVTGETGLNALVARHFEVPVALVTGDRQTAREAEEWLPGVTTVVVKESCSRYAADSLSPGAARDLITEGARRALEHLTPAPADAPVTLDLTFHLADMAAMAEWVKGVERTGERAVRVTCADGLAAYRTFYTMLLLANTAADAF